MFKNYTCLIIQSGNFCINYILVTVDSLPYLYTYDSFHFNAFLKKGLIRLASGSHNQ